MIFVSKKNYQAKVRAAKYDLRQELEKVQRERDFAVERGQQDLIALEAMQLERDFAAECSQKDLVALEAELKLNDALHNKVKAVTKVLDSAKGTVIGVKTVREALA